MDKNEFKTKYDEIKQLIKEGRTDEALDIVESTNWRKVHNVNALVKASEVCEEAGRLDLPGKPVAFQVTDTFLRVFGLGSLNDLPPLHGEVQEEPAPEADSDAEQLEWK